MVSKKLGAQILLKLRIENRESLEIMPKVMGGRRKQLQWPVNNIPCGGNDMRLEVNVWS